MATTIMTEFCAKKKIIIMTEFIFFSEENVYPRGRRLQSMPP